MDTIRRRILKVVLTCVLATALVACAAPAAAPPPSAAPKPAPTAAPTAPPKAEAPKVATTAAPAVAPTAPAAPSKKEDVTLRLGYVTAVSDLPTMVGIREKLFKAEGLKMEYQPFALGRNAVSALVAGSLDVAVMMATPFITTTSKSDDYVAIGIVQYHSRGMSLVVKKDSTIKAIADLKGKKIGTQVGSQTHYVLAEKFLPRHGLRPEDYQIVNLDLPQSVSSLAVGAVDAIGVSDPYPVQAEAEGIGRILEESFSKDDPSPVLYAARRPFVNTNPTTVTKFLTAHLRATKLLGDDFARSSKTVREFLAGHKIELSQEVVDRLVKRADFIPFFIPTMKEYLDEIAQVEKKKGNVSTLPTWDKLILKDYLEKAAAQVGMKDPYK